ncbi:replication initiator protein A [Blautia glucerasea]|nr:replication initiator protein A [Blautia glucerasea]MCB6493813.1 replication initiator protein A [Coprococcus catus]MCB6509175.1 replication initiator protein A [Dorea sp. 210702-DFI.3.125]
MFPYHYGEEAEQYTFYRIPKVLFTSPKFRKLSCEAKLLYGLLLDRMQLSVKNRWLDADGKVYIYFSQEQIAEMMGCGLKKVGSLLAELDSRKGIGLITRIRQGLGKPDRIYVRRCICVDLSEGNIQTRQNDISGYIKMTDTDMSKVPGNDTDKNKTEINDTEYLSFLSADESEESRRKQIERDAYYKIICHNIGYEYLTEECDREMLDEIVALMVDVISSDREFIWIGRDRKPFDVVKSQFLKLNAEHIRFVMKCLRENTSKVVNIRQYLLTVLYNAPLTISNYYSALVQHDLYGNED